jgi:hypothetical protein
MYKSPLVFVYKHLFLRILFKYYGTGFNLDEEIINICKQELILTKTYTYFSHSNKLTILSQS